VAKLQWSEYHQWLGEVAVAIEGPDALLRPRRTRLPDHPLAETSS